MILRVTDRPTEMRPRETFMAKRRVGMGAWTDLDLPIIYVMAMAVPSKIMGVRPTVIC